MRVKLLLAAAAWTIATPAIAGWTLMPKATPVAVAKSAMTVTPGEDWNRWSVRPSKRGETWTLDGVSLNQLQFFAGVLPGEAIYRERSKKDEPLPKFDAGMLAPEIVRAVEGSHRILLRTSLFEVGEVAPTRLGGHPGVRFTYSYSVQDEDVRRQGEGRAAIVEGKLYLVTFTAPAIHYFDAGIPEARRVMDSVRIPGASVTVGE
ncbi:hypothetical protein [Sphingomonas sp.]|uniref:hypothetical protein n=1 Tax=Sphingomonas sp. TaxID=28214 RepID=UPI002DD67648|nr:hypothetical protein [Sphingomonas sp.]